MTNTENNTTKNNISVVALAAVNAVSLGNNMKSAAAASAAAITSNASASVVPMKSTSSSQHTNDDNAFVKQMLGLFSMASTRVFRGHTSRVNSIAFSHDGRKMASGGSDKHIRLWVPESQSRYIYGEIKGHTDCVTQIVWDPSNNDVLATVSEDKTLRFWDARQNKCIGVVEVGNNHAINLAWSPSGKHVIIGTRDDNVKVVAVRHRKVVASRTFKAEINEMAIHPDGTKVLLATGEGWVEVLSFPTLTDISSLHAHTGACISIKYSPDGRLFAVGSADGVCSLWDGAELTCIRTFFLFEEPVRSVSFSYDSKVLALAAEEARICLVYTETGEVIHTVSTAFIVNCIMFHPSKYLVAYAEDERRASASDDFNAGGGYGRSRHDDYPVRVFGLPPSS